MLAVLVDSALPSSRNTCNLSGFCRKSLMALVRCSRRLSGLYIEFVLQGVIGIDQRVVGIDQGIHCSDGVVAFSGDVVKKLRSRWVKFGSRLVAMVAGSA